MPKSWNLRAIKQILNNFAISQGYRITDITKCFDTFNPTELSRWMDTCNGHVGGWYHRVQHGHDVAANIGKVYSKFGVKGVVQYPWELLKDSCTPNGVPVPGTEFIVKAKVVTSAEGTKWMSMNVADVFTGGLAIYSTYRLYKKSENGKIDKKDVIFASIGIVIKVQAGIATAHPVLLLSAGADVFILIQNLEQAKETFSDIKRFLWSDTIKGVAVGLATGATVTGAATAAAVVFGAASTGTAIATLSGAALTNATLAFFGFGALAAGGIGIVGGVVVLGAIGTGTAVAANYGYRKLTAS